MTTGTGDAGETDCTNGVDDDGDSTLHQRSACVSFGRRT
jgi:hypothetical protein